MPLLTLHLLALPSSTSREAFISKLQSTQDVELVVASRPRYWVIKPEKNDVNNLVSTQWDLMILIKTAAGSLPSTIRSQVVREYKVTVGIPSKLLAGYPEKNRQLLSKSAGFPLTGSLNKSESTTSSQGLELSGDLHAFMNDLVVEHDGPVTMLNLLHFHPDGQGKDSYYKYGQGFMKAGGRRGGDAKIVGNVLSPPSGQSDSRGESSRSPKEWWSEVAIVHYPSIRHFCDMAAGDDYQEINRKYRLPALRDTILLCTTEIDLEKIAAKAKL